MPWIRYKRWRYVSKLAPHLAVCSSGRRYLWDGADGGALQVGYAQDVDELLNPFGDLRSDYEVAWDRYDVSFDAQGREVIPEAAAAPIEQSPAKEPPAERRRPGRPRVRR